MKNTIKKVLIALIFNIGLLLALPAQDPPPPPPGGHGDDTNQPAGGAPIGSGLGILLALGAAYAGKRIYTLTKERLCE
ncbi:MAG: hypothetical protein COW63_07075 [Bacteroidetes bacterium CG18_big_fil_WC_8_21_14_2_50_41_14]|nr:MAG: hypothetical protein COW63_07075 [Bacteroidetes bacterium CG18_big_fil_WC_8_21_14_2_50_41_14]PJB56544.1 MAG: hypothetical protein CO098_13845 [Bacteroidetes bacterium CG_4_9_14_3_um_filter_41_19]